MDFFLKWNFQGTIGKYCLFQKRKEIGMLSEIISCIGISKIEIIFDSPLNQRK